MESGEACPEEAREEIRARGARVYAGGTEQETGEGRAYVRDRERGEDRGHRREKSEQRSEGTTTVRAAARVTTRWSASGRRGSGRWQKAAQRRGCWQSPQGQRLHSGAWKGASRSRRTPRGSTGLSTGKQRRDTATPQPQPRSRSP